MTKKAQVAVIGMGVMGANLSGNFAESGYSVALYNRSREKTDKVVQSSQFPEKLIPTYDFRELTDVLHKPRVAVILVAQKGVQPVIDELLDHFEKGDVIIDAGNSHFELTQNRQKIAAERGIHFLGVGVSGGEFGARHGASLMAGGSPHAWELVKPLLESVAAEIPDGVCADHMGPDGAGHFVKTVHNGIEYALMQLIAEVYDIMLAGESLDFNRKHGALNARQIFEDWNRGRLASYLIEITAKILAVNDLSGKPLLDSISDKAGQKGTGLWTVQSALELKVPTPTLLSAVNARLLSAVADRGNASLPSSNLFPQFLPDEKSLERALYSGFIAAYAQGFEVLTAASREYDWNLELHRIARVWQNGCIIRADLLETIEQLYASGYSGNLIFAEPFMQDLQLNLSSLNRLIANSTGIRVTEALCSVSNYYQCLGRGSLPLNLTQAQRDAFGAHTYRLKTSDESIHTDWLS